MELKRPPLCVLFDCDGTLVDSELLGNVALARQLALAGIAETGESLTERFRGHRLSEILATLEATHGAALPAGFVEAYRERAATMFEEGVVAMPGVAAALATLAALGLPMCIVSNGPLTKIRQTLRVSRLAPHFGDRLFSAYEVGAWKPDPGLFLHAAAAMGRAPYECVVVDDSATGVEAARRAGMRALWFVQGGAPAAVPPHATAFSDMSDLVALVRHPR